jgi:hypothetical protein
MDRASWVSIDLIILALGLAAYVLAVSRKCKSRHVIPVAMVVASAFAVWVVVRDHDTLSMTRLGLDFQHFATSLVWLGPATAFFAGLMLTYAWWNKRPVPSWRFFRVMPLYVVWGFIQQLIFQGVLHSRLQELLDSSWYVPVLVGLLFGLAHVPRWWLVWLTLVIGPIWSAIFYVSPNLYVLAASHALLGCLAYFCVNGEDPLEEFLAAATGSPSASDQAPSSAGDA